MGVGKRLKRKHNPYESIQYDSGMSTVVAGAEATNVVTVTVQLKDPQGNNLAARTRVKVWLSDSATTGAIVGTAPSGGAAISGGFGSIINQPVANKEYDCMTDATGQLRLAFTEAAGKTAFLWMQDPAGTCKVSNALTWT